MTYEEAITIANCWVRSRGAYTDCATWQTNNEAAKLAIEAMEKQIPKKPIAMNGRTFCPRCYENKAYFPVDNWNFAINLSEIHKEEVKRLTYCKHCGQAIDWSDCE